MILPAPAKINRFLKIVGRREDGYHELQTVFQFVDLCDELRFELIPENGTIEVNAPQVPGNPNDNLIYRAARALQVHTETQLGAYIDLYKRIPMGGGLGGGSSNAATTLVGLNQLWQCGLTYDELAQIGLSLGADVPIFLHGQAAFAEGVGETLHTIELPEPWLVILYPGSPVSTAEIFSHDGLTRDSSRITIADFFSHEGENDCEIIAKQLNPKIDEAMRWLNQHTSATMTGTGSCVFGQFHNQQQAQDVALAIPKPFVGFVAKGMNVSSLHQYLQHCDESIGTSPSGKALGFDPSIPRFESWRPSHFPASTDALSIHTPILTQEVPSCTK